MFNVAAEGDLNEVPAKRAKRTIAPEAIMIPAATYLDVADVSSDLELRWSEKKGYCVFTKRDVAPNSIVKYGGVLITAAEKDRLLKEAGQNSSDLAEYITATGMSDQYEDAHPRHQDRLGNIYGGRINEPDQDIAANMLFTTDKESGRVILVTVETVPKGRELTAHYGATANFARRYVPGKPAAEPAWW